MANYATQYAQALSQQYPHVLHFGALFARNQEADYRWVNNHTIEIPSISVTGRIDGSRTALIARTQRHSNTWTPLTLRNHRSWNDFIHPRDIDETNQVLTIQNITRVLNEEEKFPEKDKYLISTFYSDWTNTGRVPLTGNLTTDNILDYFDTMMVNATEHNVPGDRSHPLHHSAGERDPEGRFCVLPRAEHERRRSCYHPAGDRQSGSGDD